MKLSKKQRIDCDLAFNELTEEKQNALTEALEHLQKDYQEKLKAVAIGMEFELSEAISRMVTDLKVPSRALIGAIDGLINSEIYLDYESELDLLRIAIERFGKRVMTMEI